MYDSEKIHNAVTVLKQHQADGMTLGEATRLLHDNEHIPFDTLWPAIMKLQQLSEKEAMRLTKEWCVSKPVNTTK